MTSQPLRTVLLLLIILNSRMLFAVEIQMTSDFQASKGIIAFSWQSVASYQADVTTKEILIRFREPVHMTIPESYYQQSSGWIEDFSLGYDSILLRFPEQINWKHVEKNSFILILIRQVHEPDQELTLLAQLLESELRLQEGYEEEYIDFIENLYKKKSDNIDIIMRYAQAEYNIGRIMKSKALADQALSISPWNQSIKEFQESLTARPWILAEIRFKETSTYLAENIYYLQTEYGLEQDNTLGMELAEELVYDGTVQQGLDAGLSTWQGPKYYGHFYLRHDYDSGNKAIASIFMNQRTPGIGASYYWWDFKGFLGVHLQYRKPYWDSLSFILGDGTRDQLKIERYYRFTPFFTITLDASLRKYQLNGDYEYSRTYATHGNLHYQFPEYHLLSFLFGANHLFTFDYDYDQETPLTGPMRVHTHKVTWALNKKFSGSWDNLCFYSYTLNLIGPNSWTAGDRITFHSTKSTDFYAAYNYTHEYWFVITHDVMLGIQHFF
ncbi:MAG: hypothetical protein HQM12_07130 [SAR324 cluster bacterium]|nr:hypothetical protein [SAR324 cluster bacterium]MBF0349786.1 hypothetical protein [SAR324 cluster bacterium]